MKNKIIIILLIIILLVSGCEKTSLTTKDPEKISRGEAELKAFKFLYEHTQNKDVYDKELKVENYIFDSWKEESVWHVIIYVGHTFIEVLVYDDGSNNIKVLAKTDYWRRVPKDVKTKVYDNMNKDTGVEFS
ncbi:MAG: hypothetical protein ISS23_03205 [Nanoarchaeota archaeon]|nr:hypothetical protein [Nanoarchaeota archaeon]